MTSTSSPIQQVVSDDSLSRIGISSLFARSPLQSASTSHHLRSNSSVTPLTTANPDRVAPRARLAISNITSAGTTHNFKVTYSDRGKVNKRSINARDILVTGPTGFRQFASLVNVRLNRARTSAVATYRINAAGGSWDAADNGAYTVAVQRRQVSDISRNFVRAGRLGGFQVNVAGSTTPPPNPLPTAAFGSGSISNASTFTFTVNYADDAAVNVTSIDSSDLLVTGPNGFSQAATLVGVSPTGNGTPRTATYAVTAPGGTWDNPDNGTYTIALQANQVSDTQGAFAAAGNLGTFLVNQPPSTEQQAPTVSSFSAPAIASGEGNAQFTVTYADNVGIAIASLGNGDVQVTGPNGFSQLATLVNVNTNSNGTPRTATYRINAPGGSWNMADNGTYTVSVQASQVLDTSGNGVVAGTAGTFAVTLSSPDVTLNGSGTGNNTVTGGTGNDTVTYASSSTGVLINLETGRTVKPIYGGAFSNKIMPLGDSITAGEHTTNPVPGAYRIELYENFTNDGFAIDFVGSQTNGPTSNFDRNHEGYPGETIAGSTIDPTGLEDRILNGSISFDPKLSAVLLMVGTNDTGSEFESNAEMIDDLSDLIDTITSRTDALVVVSSILPLTNSTRNTRAQTYNSAIPGLVSTKVGQGKRVTFANVGGALTTGDLTTDGIHPTAAGYDELGDRWYDAIADRDTLSSVENVIGTNFVDTIVGNAGANIITGGAGDDRLTGGGGADTFVYRSAAEGNDTIVDFTSSDFLQISAAGFGGGLAAGISLSNGVAAATGVFVNGTTAIGTSANFLFSGGILSFDADGTGAGTAVAIATLSGGPATLSINQFNIIA